MSFCVSSIRQVWIIRCAFACFSFLLCLACLDDLSPVLAPLSVAQRYALGERVQGQLSAHARNFS